MRPMLAANRCDSVKGARQRSLHHMAASLARMSAPVRKPRPEVPPPPAPTPRLRPRHVREAEAAPLSGDALGVASGPGEVRRLQDRIARAFTSPQPGSLERTLMKLIILAATCLFLRTAIAGLAGLAAAG
jgi:hypothetical protein